MKLTRNLRSRLLGVALLALIPLVGFFLYSWQQLNRLAAEGWNQEMTLYAEMAAAGKRDLLREHRTVLSVLAELPRAQHFDPSLCTELFDRLREERGGYTVLAAVEPTFHVRCMVPALEGDLDLSDRVYIQEALATGRPTIGEFVIGRVSGIPSIAMAHPVFGEDGEIHTILASGIDLRMLTGRLASSHFPPGTTLTLFDALGQVLLRLPEDAREPPPAESEELPRIRTVPSLLEASTSEAPSGSYHLVDLDGVRRVFSFAPLALEGMDEGTTVAAGFDPSLATASIDQAQRMNLIGLFLAAAVLLLGIWGLLEFAILRKLAQVVDAAEKLGGGDLSARTGVSYGTGELSHLARTFDEMAANLQRLREAEALWAEGEIREREERFTQIAASINEVFWLADPNDGGLLYVSPAYESIWGRPLEHAFTDAEAWLETVHPEDRDTLAATLGAGPQEESEIEYRIIRPDRTVRWVRERSFPVFAEDGSLHRVVSVSADVTEGKKLEEQLRQSHKMEAVGRLAGGVAHDFNNILTAIQGHTELLLREADGKEAIADDLQEIGRAADRAAALTRQLLTFSRVKMLKLSVLRPAAVVARMEELLRRVIGSHIELVTDVDPESGPIRADEGQLEQIILNLAVNARDAMPDGGTLTITTRTVSVSSQPAEALEPVEPGRYVRLSVSDTGPGIPEELQDRIFEPFFTTKGTGRGTGLGLATVYGIVKQCGGAISLVNTSAGATFAIYFPLAEETEGRVVPSPSEEPGGGGGSEVVLLAEDDAGVRRIALRILESEGYRVLEAEDGMKAAQLAKGFAGRIDLLLTDVIMPNLQGPALAARLAAERPEMKVLFISGYAEQAMDGGRPLPPGAVLLPKPFSAAALLREVRRALDGPVEAAGATI